MISPSLKQKFYPNNTYNGTFLFYDWIHNIITNDFVVLNLGAGPGTGEAEQSLRGEVAEVVGADIDPAVLENNEVDRAVIIKDGRLDLASESPSIWSIAIMSLSTSRSP